MAQDNSGMGVVLGVLVTVVIIVGAYFVFGGDMPGGSTSTNTTIDMPDVNVTPPAPSK